MLILLSVRTADTTGFFILAFGHSEFVDTQIGDHVSSASYMLRYPTCRWESQERMDMSRLHIIKHANLNTQGFDGLIGG